MEWISTRNACCRLGVSLRTPYRYSTTVNSPAYKRGRVIRLPPPTSTAFRDVPGRAGSTDRLPAPPRRSVRSSGTQAPWNRPGAAPGATLELSKQGRSTSLQGAVVVPFGMPLPKGHGQVISGHERSRLQTADQGLRETPPGRLPHIMISQTFGSTPRLAAGLAYEFVLTPWRQVTVW